MNPNISLSISGNPKSGKTHWAFSFPAPILVFSFDLGVKRVLPHYAGKAIETKSYPLPILDTVHPKPYAKALWQEISKDFKDALASAEWQTIVVDPATTLYHVACHAWAEELGQRQLLQFQYGEVYARLSALYVQAQLSGKHLVLTHYLREAYRKNEPTGELELDGYKRTEGLVDIVLLTERVSKPKGGAVIRTTIVDCGFDLELCGYQAEDMSYQTLIELLGFGG